MGGGCEGVFEGRDGGLGVGLVWLYWLPSWVVEFVGVGVECVGVGASSIDTVMLLSFLYHLCSSSMLSLHLEQADHR